MRLDNYLDVSDYLELSRRSDNATITNKYQISCTIIVLQLIIGNATIYICKCVRN